MDNKLILLTWLVPLVILLESAKEVPPYIVVAAKIEGAFGVSLDYLVGEGQNASFDKITVQRIQEIQNLDPNTQTVLFNLFDTYLSDAKARAA